MLLIHRKKRKKFPILKIKADSRLLNRAYYIFFAKNRKAKAKPTVPLTQRQEHCIALLPDMKLFQRFSDEIMHKI